ncbi:GDP-mannose 4,6-dehydratase [Ideonella sp. BN130291]|uniref:GDP-mannose 4,6-dehydratase n=1 Tax=Ideonella sp. BN130291 TaxID=3112940 RepID=UPI002E266F40|nr:GDP-mannose 4,6-dehydratase [Ideonella sp. BN130291]
MSKKVLVTGADGFTGRYLVRRLAAAGHEVHGLVHHSPTMPVEGATSVLQADLRDAEGLARMAKAMQPQWVAHLAAIAFVAHGDADAMYATNLVGTRHLLEALVSCGTLPEAVLLASSANVYGNSTEGSLDESSDPAPANDYAVSKLAMEYLARLYASRLPLIVTRPFNYTGVGQSESFLLPKIISHVRRRAALIELGNLHVARDFSDVRMVVEAYARLLQTPAATGGTFNVCSGRAYTLQEVLDMVKRLSGHPFEVRVNPAFVRSNEVTVLLGDRRRLDECIGPLEPIALQDTLDWMLRAP